MVDADTAVVGEEGEVDFKEEAKFAQHMKEKGEAVSDFARMKTLSQQRQYLPIYSVRDELLQVKCSHVNLTTSSMCLESALDSYIQVRNSEL